MAEEPKVENEVAQNDRRDFLKKAGRFAIVAPPTMTMLLSSSVAKATGSHHGGGDIAKSCDDGHNKLYGGHHTCKPDYDDRDYDDWWDWIKKWLDGWWKP